MYISKHHAFITFFALPVGLGGCTLPAESPEMHMQNVEISEISPQSLEEPGDFDIFAIETVSIPGSSRNRTVSATICAPSNDGGQSVVDGSFPLIIVSPGATQSRNQYRSHCDHMASWGMVVISENFVGNSGFFPPSNHNRLADDLIAVIDWATSEDNPVFAAVDAEAIGVAGHSMGGKVSLLAAARDPRIKAAVGWDPVDANGPFTSPSSPDFSSVTPEMMPDITAAVAVLGETTNSRGSFFSPACAPRNENFQQYFEFSSIGSLEVDIFDADHMDWIDGSGCFPCSPCNASDRPFVRALTRRVTTAWFRLHLLGDEQMQPILELSDEVAADLVSVRHK